jgi:cytochrome c-type biogenesis protein CcmH
VATLAAAALLLVVPAAGSQDAPADSPEMDARTARVADQLRCPVCRSQSVLESSSTLAREMKAEIRRRLAEGQTPEEVKAYFVSRYGEWVLLRPEPRGLNLVVYVLPPLLLVGGGLLVWALLRRWSPRGGSDGGSADPGPAGPAPTDAGAVPGDGLSEEEERRLEEAMRERT